MAVIMYIQLLTTPTIQGLVRLVHVSIYVDQTLSTYTQGNLTGEFLTDISSLNIILNLCSQKLKQIANFYKHRVQNNETENDRTKSVNFFTNTTKI